MKKLSLAQEQQILDTLTKAQKCGSLIETDREQIIALRKRKQSAYLANKKIIDQVFYHEMASSKL